MKVILAFFFSTFVGVSVFATTLFRCDPPLGSSLQEVKFVLENKMIFRVDLNQDGAFSAKERIPEDEWIRKDLVWSHSIDGQVHLFRDGDGNWFYESVSPYKHILGVCR